MLSESAQGLRKVKINRLIFSFVVGFVYTFIKSKGHTRSQTSPPYPTITCSQPLSPLPAYAQSSLLRLPLSQNATRVNTRARKKLRSSQRAGYHPGSPANPSVRMHDTMLTRRCSSDVLSNLNLQFLCGRGHLCSTGGAASRTGRTGTAVALAASESDPSGGVQVHLLR